MDANGRGLVRDSADERALPESLQHFEQAREETWVKVRGVLGIEEKKPEPEKKPQPQKKPQPEKVKP